MKNRLVILIIILSIACLNQSYSQHGIPVAVSKYGILMGKYKITPDTRNSIPDTISAEEARNIFALNAYYNDKNDLPHKIPVKEFQTTIVFKNDTSRTICKDEFLPEDVTKKLINIQSTSYIFFEGIIGKPQDGNYWSIGLLSFYVK